MDTPLMYVYGLLIIDRKAFERISADDQAVVNEVMRDVFRKLNQLNRSDNEQARAALQKNGIQFIKPSEENRQRWQDKVIGAMDGLSRQGVFSETILKTLRGHLHDFRNQARAAE
jgi:TRAP-type C4-dicarboxylate transport system substrate-binding protein